MENINVNKLNLNRIDKSFYESNINNLQNKMRLNKIIAYICSKEEKQTRLQIRDNLIV